VKTYQVVVNGHAYVVEIDDLHATPVRVRVDGEPFAVTLEEQRAGEEPLPPVERAPVKVLPRPAGPAPTAAAAVSGSVVAPMPGSVVDIQVHAGDTVTRGQVLCYLEAMKMKNAIKSPRDGVVATVVAGEGQAVAYGDVLVTFE
jgi:biotin carboxyl carrier protein